jgi:hypothetical protein
MRKAGLISSWILTAAAIFAVGAQTDHHWSEYPRITTEPSLENPSDAITAVHRCAKTASWQVTLKAGEPLVLELLTCPTDFHPQVFKEDDDADWPWPEAHQVLLLERRRRWQTAIVSALYSDLNFRRVEPGRIEGSNTDAVLWSYNIKCGSCHGGPEGILMWNDGGERYEWNAEWLGNKPQSVTIEAALPENYYLDEAESLFWSEDRSGLYLRSAVHSPADAHCCPEGGSLNASIKIQNGKLTLTDVSYQKPL